MSVKKVSNRRANIISSLMIMFGIALVVGIFALTDYAFKNWGDDAGVFLWIMPPYCFGSFGALLGGVALTLVGIWRIATFSKK